MSMKKIYITYGCANMHLTRVEVINPTLEPDGSVSGYVGSAADFCDICGNSTMTGMDAEEVSVE